MLTFLLVFFFLSLFSLVLSFPHCYSPLLSFLSLLPSHFYFTFCFFLSFSIFLFSFFLSPPFIASLHLPLSALLLFISSPFSSASFFFFPSYFFPRFLAYLFHCPPRSSLPLLILPLSSSPPLSQSVALHSTHSSTLSSFPILFHF